MSDRVEITKETLKDGTENITYSKSWEKNGMNHRKEVRKVEGGYIVTMSKHGKPKDQEDAEWIDERREFVTTENPFEEAKEEKKEEKKEEHKMFKFIDMPTLM